MQSVFGDEADDCCITCCCCFRCCLCSALQSKDPNPAYDQVSMCRKQIYRRIV
jgi:hypothetical protein